MTGVRIQVDAEQAIRTVRDEWQKKQVPFAIARALTWTAMEVAKEEQRTMERVFDRPKPFTLKSLYVKPATKKKLEAEVGHKEFAPKGTAAARYLLPQIHGGFRPQKRGERALQAKLPGVPAWVAPGGGQRLDQYGNITAGAMTKILSGLSASPDAYQNVTRKSAARRPGQKYFIGKPGGGRLPLGVYLRRGRKVGRPLLVFISKPKYRQRYPFFQVAKRTAQKLFPKLFEKSLADALADAAARDVTRGIGSFADLVGARE
jgi:hypothetical protein